MQTELLPLFCTFTLSHLSSCMGHMKTAGERKGLRLEGRAQGPEGLPLHCQISRDFKHIKHAAPTFQTNVFWIPHLPRACPLFFPWRLSPQDGSRWLSGCWLAVGGGAEAPWWSVRQSSRLPPPLLPFVSGAYISQTVAADFECWDPRPGLLLLDPASSFLSGCILYLP